MKKSKLLKSLVALAVSMVAVIGCICLAACGGGETAVNKVSLNKTEITLQVDGTETLVATTDPAGAAVTWSSADSTKVEVDQTGKVTAKAVTTSPVLITAKAGEKTATCSVTVTAKQAATTTRNFSYAAIAISTDNQKLTQNDLSGPNSFLTINGDVAWRSEAKATGGAIEVKKDALTVTFQGTGTLTISWGATSSSNVSGIAVKKADGTKLEAVSVPEGVTRLEADEVINEKEAYTNEAGFYKVTGGASASTAVTLTFNITEAGTYTISGRWCYEDSSKTDGAAARGTRIFAIQMVDTPAA